MLPSVHMLTCPRRQEICADTLTRWRTTDWPGAPRVHMDNAPDDPARPWGTAARVGHLVEAFATMLRRALEEPAPADQWLLLLEDDLEFHPKIGSRVAAWTPLLDPSCVLATLFNPQLPIVEGSLLHEHAFITSPRTFLGAQALLVRRSMARVALGKWDTATGTQSQRMARILGEIGSIFVYSPSLVQHVGKISSWGANPIQALDFQKDR